MALRNFHLSHAAESSFVQCAADASKDYLTEHLCADIMNLLAAVERLQFTALFRPRLVALGLGVSVWCCAIAFGFGLLLHYKGQAGDRGTPPGSWPSGHSLTRSLHRQTLLVFSHPHCPCTRATFRELDRAVSQGVERADVHIIFIGINGLAGSAANTRLATAASQLGFAKIHYDNGELGKLFHVYTSGHVLLYDMEGDLQFSGGITASRGHEGASLGGGAVTSLLLGIQSKTTTAPAYGCPLFSKQANCNTQPCAIASKGP